jgi:hypothetical protein
MRRLRNDQAQTPAPAADVLLADGMTLPFRRECMDAVLCIAVLHHISSPARRLAFLAALRDLLKPGCPAMVTVWATEQEDPAKTVDKWTPLELTHMSNSVGNGSVASHEWCHAERQGLSWRSGDGGGPRMGSEDTRSQMQGTGQASCCQGAVAGVQETAAGLDTEDTKHSCITAGGGHGSPGADYFVPWQVPFHRAGLSRPALPDSQSGEPRSFSETGRRGSEDRGPPSAYPQQAMQSCNHGIGQHRCKASQDAVPAEGDVNEQKKTVVYNRYYHLFAAGELEELIHQLAGVKLRSSTYDASNWVVVFERSA